MITSGIRVMSPAWDYRRFWSRKCSGSSKNFTARVLTIFQVEQNVHQTLKIADYCYEMENGRIVKEGTGKDMEKDASIRDTYLGI